MKFVKFILVSVFTLIVASVYGQNKTLWLDQLDMSKIKSGWSTSKSNKSVDGNPLSIGGQKFDRGVGTHSLSRFMLNLNKRGVRFSAKVGVDDEKAKGGSVEFYLIGDKKVIWKSGLMKSGDKPKAVDVDLKGIEKLAFLITTGNDTNDSDHADWCDAKIEYVGEKQLSFEEAIPQTPKYILTPKSAATPRINGAKITGASPDKPFLYTIAATGVRPMTFSAQNLPAGLKLDPRTGIISGKVAKEGVYKVKVSAKNAKGVALRNLRIVIGNDKLSLTPPMGWNSWNCWGLTVSEEKVKASTDAMVKSGLINHGWTYINIDDGWEAPKRAADGEIVTNDKFPDMKRLCDYVHSKGLKIGIYSSPGELTCGGYLGSFGHEGQDAATYAKWGIDYLKYDWCSYGDKVNHSNPELDEYKKPYATMRPALKNQNRDIVYSLCQYGMGDVWKWGAEMGQLWRTTGDINDSWESLYNIGFSQGQCSPYAKPGNWNDPDMLVVGKVGWGPSLHDTKLTADEQYTHISLWSLLASPLLIGCDMSQIDPFTLNLLTNDEVIDVNQDPLGKQAKRISKDNEKEIWVKDLEDGSKAVGLFFIGGQGSNPEDYFNWGGESKAKLNKVSVSWADLGISGNQKVRDLWRQKSLGIFSNKFEAEVPYHGVVFVKISKVK